MSILLIAFLVGVSKNERLPCGDEVVMGIFSRILNLFSGGGIEGRLKKGLDLAKAGKPEAAITVYNGLLEAAEHDDFRARILLNRALAYSALGDDVQAEYDLKLVLVCQQSAETVRATAREKLARVQKRMSRIKGKSNN